MTKQQILEQIEAVKQEINAKAQALSELQAQLETIENVEALEKDEIRLRKDEVIERLKEILGDEDTEKSTDTIRGLLAYDVAELESFSPVALYFIASALEDVVTAVVDALTLS